MNAEDKKIGKEIVEKYHNEFSLLGRYDDLTWEQLYAQVSNDLVCVRAYAESLDCINEGKADNFVEFLRQFTFYAQGKGSTWPANFSDVDYCDVPTGRHLGEEMRKVLVAALEKS